MADRPILFSAPMVKALLAGRKVQTRRLIKIEPNGKIIDFVKVATDTKTGRYVYEMKDAVGNHVSIKAGRHFVEYQYMPPFAVGDRLWVKEAWRTQEAFDANSPSEICAEFESEWGAPSMPTFYEADKQCDGHSIELWQQSRPGRLRASMHMPRVASRLTLVVESVKIERLQDISEEDACAEGLGYMWTEENEEDLDRPVVSARQGFAHIWDSINGEGSWEQNPWVVAYTFKCIPQNIDQIGGAA